MSTFSLKYTKGGILQPSSACSVATDGITLGTPAGGYRVNLGVRVGL